MSVCVCLESAPVPEFPERYAAALLLPTLLFPDLPHTLGLHPLGLLTEALVQLQLLLTQNTHTHTSGDIHILETKFYLKHKSGLLVYFVRTTFIPH